MVEARIDSIAAEDDVIHALKCSVEKAKDEKRYAEKVDFVVKFFRKQFGISAGDNMCKRRYGDSSLQHTERTRHKSA